MKKEEEREEGDKREDRLRPGQGCSTTRWFEMFASSMRNARSIWLFLASPTRARDPSLSFSFFALAVVLPFLVLVGRRMDNFPSRWSPSHVVPVERDKGNRPFTTRSSRSTTLHRSSLSNATRFEIRETGHWNRADRKFTSQLRVTSTLVAEKWQFFFSYTMTSILVAREK